MICQKDLSETKLLSAFSGCKRAPSNPRAERSARTFFEITVRITAGGSKKIADFKNKINIFFTYKMKYPPAVNFDHLQFDHLQQ